MITKNQYYLQIFLENFLTELNTDLEKNRKIVKSLQFMVFFALGSGAPFLSIYFKQLLINSDGTPATYWIGLIFFIQTFSGIISPLIAGYIADKFKIQNRILATCAVAVFTSGILLLIPGISSLSFNSKVLIFIVAMAMNGLFLRPIVPLIDTETLTYLQTRYNNVNAYGRYRVFGTIGWIVASCFIGTVLFLTKNIIFAIICYSFSFLILAVTAFSGIKSKITTIKIPWNYLKRDTTMKLFLIFVLLFSIGFSSSIYFTGYFLHDKNVNYFIIGLVFGLAAALEIPVIFLGDKINKFLSLKAMIITGCFIIALKLLVFFIIAHTNNPLLFVGVNIISGLGHGLYFYAIVRYPESLAHKDLRATYQNLYHLVFTIGASIGMIFSSLIIEIHDSRLLILLDSLILFAAAIYFLFIPHKISKNINK